MARLLRNSCLAAAVTAALGALPAAAQFNPFEAIFGSPPRPPGSVPGGRQPPPPPPQQQAYPQYPDQRNVDPRYQDPRYQDPRYQQQDPRYQDPRYGDPQYPDQARQGPPGTGGVQSQPLPPPPGGTAAALPPGQPLGQPLPGAAPGGVQRPRGPADTSPQPGDEVIVEPPSLKIANKGALFSGL